MPQEVQFSVKRCLLFGQLGHALAAFFPRGKCRRRTAFQGADPIALFRNRPHLSKVFRLALLAFGPNSVQTLEQFRQLSFIFDEILCNSAAVHFGRFDRFGRFGQLLFEVSCPSVHLYQPLAVTDDLLFQVGGPAALVVQGGFVAGYAFAVG